MTRIGILKREACFGSGAARVKVTPPALRNYLLRNSATPRAGRLSLHRRADFRVEADVNAVATGEHLAAMVIRAARLAAILVRIATGLRHVDKGPAGL